MSTEGDTTVYAQARQHYDNVMAREQRRVTHGGLTSAAVPELAPGANRGFTTAGSAVAELVKGLAPDAEDDAA